MEWKFEYMNISLNIWNESLSIEYKFEYMEWKFEYMNISLHIEYNFEYIEYMQLWVTYIYHRGDLHRL